MTLSEAIKIQEKAHRTASIAHSMRLYNHKNLDSLKPSISKCARNIARVHAIIRNTQPLVDRLCAIAEYMPIDSSFVILNESTGYSWTEAREEFIHAIQKYCGIPFNTLWKMPDKIIDEIVSNIHKARI